MSIANVLLVDDEVSFVETLSKRLSKRGFHIITAFDGQEALERLDENPSIQVVVLDIKMPGMDGLKTLKEIRKRQSRTEVIILTGLATVKAAIESMRLGAYDCLMKPCDIDQLTSRIGEAAMKPKQAPANAVNSTDECDECSDC